MDRRLGIGGSDSAVIFDCSPYKTKVELFLEKTGYQEIPNEKQQQIFERGHLLEGLIKKLFSLKYGYKLQEMKNELVHPEYDFIRGNIDAYCPEKKAIIECKTAAVTKGDINHGWGLHNTDQIPIHYLLQCHHYLLLIPEAEKVYVPVLRTTFRNLELLSRIVKKYGIDTDVLDMYNCEIEVFRVDRNEYHEVLAKKMIDKYIHFWNEYVLKNVRPPSTKVTDVEKLFPNVIAKDVVANKEIIEAVEQIKFLKQNISILENEMEQEKLKVCSFLENANTLIDAEKNKLATYKVQATSRFDSVTFKKDHPELFKDYTTTSSFRVFKLI